MNMSDQRKVAFYIRVSTKHQDTPEGSLKSQEQRLEEWRNYNNTIKNNPETGKDGIQYSSATVYKDVESGASGEKRPGYQSMLLDIKSNSIDAIACTSISRLNRNLREFYDLMDLCSEHQVDIISLKENFDTSSAIGRALLKFMLVFYELEREQTSERGKDNRYARFKRGLWVTGTVLGYDNDEGMLIPIPEEVEIVNKMFDFYILTGSIKKTADLLYEKGYLTPARKFTGNNDGKRKKFPDQTIRRALTNKTYIGVSQWKKGNINKLDLSDPQEKYQECQGQWESIVSQDKFNRANDILENNTKTRTNSINPSKKIYQLTNILKCGICSDNPLLRVVSGTSKNKKTYRYYKCPVCGNKIGAEIIEDTLLEQVVMLAQNEDHIKKIISKKEVKNTAEIKELKNRLSSLKSEEIRINSEIDTTIEQLDKIKDSKVFYKRLADKDKEFKYKLKKNIEDQQQITDRIKTIELGTLKPEILMELFSNIKDYAEKMAPAHKRKLFQIAFTQCLLYKEDIEVTISEEVKIIPIYAKTASAESVFSKTTVKRD